MARTSSGHGDCSVECLQQGGVVMGHPYRMGLPEEYNGFVFIAFYDGRQVFIDPVRVAYAEAVERLMDLFAAHADPRHAYISTVRLDEAAVRQLIAMLDPRGETMDLPDPVIGWFGR